MYLVLDIFRPLGIGFKEHELEAFYDSQTVKLATLCLVLLFFAVAPMINGSINKRLPSSIRSIHAELTKDIFIKIAILLSASIAAALLALATGGFNKSVSQAFFGLCLFSSLNSFHQIYKTQKSIRKARSLSQLGSRKRRIDDVESINKKRALTAAIFSFMIGLIGFLYVAFVFSNLSPSWVWFVGFCSTAVAVQAVCWSYASSVAISWYVSNPTHGQ